MRRGNQYSRQLTHILIGIIALINVGPVRSEPSPHRGRPVFVDYRNIGAVHFVNGSHWLVDACDDIVFENDHSANIWRTYLFRNHASGDNRCVPDDWRHLERDGKLVYYHGTRPGNVAGEYGDHSRDEYWFDIKDKTFGKQRINVKEKNTFSDIEPGYLMRHYPGYEVRDAPDPKRCIEGGPCAPTSGFSIYDNVGKKNFYPLPITNPREFYVWRPKHPRNSQLPVINEAIGPSERRATRIWFGITFAEGEGFDGVGGIGYFDLNRKKYHIFRPQLLRDYSVRRMLVDWPYMWLSTISHGELGHGPGTGLIQIDLRTLHLMDPLIRQVALSSLVVEDISLIARRGSFLWVISATGIHRYHEARNRWEHFRVELKMTTDTIPVAYPVSDSELKQYHASGWKLSPTRITYGYRKGDVVRYFSTKNSFYEVEAKTWREGYISFRFGGKGWCRDLALSGGWHKDCDVVPLYPRKEDASSGGKIIGAFLKGPLRRGSATTMPLSEKVRIKSIWIPGESAIPMIRGVDSSE